MSNILPVEGYLDIPMGLYRHAQQRLITQGTHHTRQAVVMQLLELMEDGMHTNT